MNPVTVDYKILSSRDLGVLADAVRDLLLAGDWLPQGGVSKLDGEYVQAMVKYAPIPEPKFKITHSTVCEPIHDQTPEVKVGDGTVK